MSRIGFIIPLALISWLTYIGAGMWKHGALGYFKHATMPSGVGGPILLLLVPLEFFSNIIVRPFTLTLRLFGNMFAGHLLLILFATGGAALITSGNLLYGGVGILSFALGIGVSFLEMLVMFLQAYVFTLLSSLYIGEALAEEH
jgi:F-type H+-transporting ATPase subunit a